MQTTDRDMQKSTTLPSRSLPEEEISLWELLLVFKNRKKILVLTTFGFGVVATIVSLVLPSQYTATTTILPPQNSNAGAALVSQLSNLGPMAALAGGGLGVKNPNDMYVALIRTQTVEDAMVRRFNLISEYHAKKRSDAREAFESHSDVQGSAKDGLIRISVTDKNPKRAAEMANSYVEEFRKLSATLAITEASQRRAFFEQQLKQAKDNLANSEEALKVTEQTTGLLQLDSQAMMLIQTAASLRAQIAVKEVELQAMRSFASSQNPDLLLAEQELAGWKAQLSNLTGNRAASVDDMMIPKGKVATAGLEYIRKRRDVKYYETIFELLSKQFEMAKLDEARQGSMIQVVDPADVPDWRSSPKRKLIVLVASGVGLVLGLLWVLLTDALASAKLKKALQNIR